MADNITATIGGKIYEGWTSVKVTRALLHCAADFDISVSEAWAGTSSDPPWQIKPFDTCVIAVDGAPVLTGFVEHYEPSYDKSGHTVRIGGRSKTCDIIDCMPEIKGGQFNGYTLDKIAKAVCAPFGITVLVKTDMGAAIPNATLEKCETAFDFLDKLCALHGVLAFDDADGNLVLDRAGTQSGSGALVEGQNIWTAQARLTSDKRFSDYVVLGQAPLAWDSQDAQLEIKGTAKDAACPRFRRFSEMAEGPADTATATQRAQWRAQHNFGECTEATIAVRGWRQTDGGDLWRVNQLIPVNSPRMQLDQPLLVSKVAMILDQSGRRTELSLAPPEAFVPQVPKPKKHKKGNSPIWSGAL